MPMYRGIGVPNFRGGHLRKYLQIRCSPNVRWLRSCLMLDDTGACPRHILHWWHSKNRFVCAHVAHINFDFKSLSLSLPTGGARCPEEVFRIVASGRRSPPLSNTSGESSRSRGTSCRGGEARVKGAAAVRVLCLGGGMSTFALVQMRVASRFGAQFASRPRCYVFHFGVDDVDHACQLLLCFIELVG